MIMLLIAIVLAGICGLLSSLTGDGAPKWLRRGIAPLLTMLFVLIVTKKWLTIFLMARGGVLSQGYGIPDPSDPKPSKFGAFWYKIFKGDHQKTAIAVRATLGVQECFVMSLIPIATGHWFWFVPACAGVIWNWVYFGAIKQNEGVFKLFGHNLLWEEFEINAIDTFIFCLLGILCR